MIRRIAKFSLATVLTCTLALPGAYAQTPAQPASKGPPNALQGFSQNRDQPVHIESATLEVRDKDKVATFSGDVRVVQGDTRMRSKTLVVFYDDDEEAKGKSLQAATPGPGGQQKIKRLEARGSVVVTQKDQTATGELGIFDMKANTVTLTTNVVMTQGQNILKGGKLTVDLTNGVSRVDTGKDGRVQGLFIPGSAGPETKSGGAPSAAPATPQRAPVVRPF